MVLSLPPGMTAQGAAAPVSPELATVQTTGIQATSVPTAQGQTVVVHVPVTAATQAALVPVSVIGKDAAQGTISSEPENAATEAKDPAPASVSDTAAVPSSRE